MLLIGLNFQKSDIDGINGKGLILLYKNYFSI